MIVSSFEPLTIQVHGMKRGFSLFLALHLLFAVRICFVLIMLYLALSVLCLLSAFEEGWFFLFLLDWALSIKSAAIHLKQADYCSSFSFLLDTEVVVSLTSLLWVAAAKVAAEMVGSQVFLLAESLVCLKWLVRIATRLEWPAYLRMPQASPFSIAAFHASLFFFYLHFLIKVSAIRLLVGFACLGCWSTGWKELDKGVLGVYV